MCSNGNWGFQYQNPYDVCIFALRIALNCPPVIQTRQRLQAVWWYFFSEGWCVVVGISLPRTLHFSKRSDQSAVIMARSHI